AAVRCHGEAEIAEDARLLVGGDLEPAEASDSLRPQRQPAAPVGQRAGADSLARLAAGELADQPGRHLGTPLGRDRVDAALEAVASVALDAERAAGRGHPALVEQCDLE